MFIIVHISLKKLRIKNKKERKERSKREKEIRIKEKVLLW